MQEVEVQEVFVKQLEKDKKELTVEKNMLEVDINTLELDKQSLEKELEKRGRLLGTFEATAYTDDVESQGKWVGQTASGMKPQVGVIAVDHKVIPLGTKLYVEGYGNAIAGDVGSAIKGNRVDLFMETRENCMEFGRKNVKVWIVK